MAGAFNDLRRSTARLQLLILGSLGLLTEGELARFSPETRSGLDGGKPGWRA